MKTEIYNLNGESVGEIDLDDKIFGKPWNPDLVHQALMTQVANRRQNLAHAKDRSEKRGGGRKPWRQKGTGRARHGSIRSPIWSGGGVTHGPTKEKNYSKKINKKMKQAAMFSLISKKLTDKELKVIDSLKMSSPKTKELDSAIKKFLKVDKNSKKLSTLLVPAKDNRAIFRSSSNISKLKSLDAKSLNIEDLLKYKNVLIDRNAVAEIK